MKHLFEKFAERVTIWAGSSLAFGLACAVVLAWGITGPVFNFSNTWQLIINTGTTIVTFLMVFLIQKAQNKDSKATQLKLNELLASNRRANNQMVNVEGFTEEELDVLHRFYEKLAQKAEQEADIRKSHSIDAAEELHKAKKAGRQ